MTDSARLHARDAATRKRLWGPFSSGAFIAPTLPQPRTKAEKTVRAMLVEKEGANTYLLHVYNVVELMEQAYAAGVAASKVVRAKGGA